ncbi:PAS domain S-box protein [Trichocoleus sp. FACHB-591]|uniref:hybrid sensor histidine kinase/response regulator n=1 Tax=Trichocoleus sp. FACHB-591 TaxID=2692872 RepID=UPI0016853178|nr:PAS domain S-box protein [Trichocoleus sp. FACHB-591]MBD2095235.1 PAS domain S-box protein [Trichocoleus sp. FACHB-591]
MYAQAIKILLVEDSLTDATFLQKILQIETSVAAWEVVHVTQLSDTLTYLREDECDVVLLDLFLPDEQGLATLQQVHATAPNTPIVVLTGLDDEAIAIETLRQGAQDYLVKGQIEVNLLVRAIRYAIERSQTLKIMQRQSAAIEAASDGVAILNQDEQFIYLNQAYAEIYGYDSPAELLGQTWRLVYDDDDLKGMARRAALDLQAKGSWRGEVIAKKQDGEKFYQELSLTAIDKDGFICIVRDVTERKRVEEALQFTQFTVNHAAEAVIWTGPDAGFVYVNEAACQMLGYSQSELLVMTIFDIAPDASPESWQEDWSQLKQQGSYTLEAWNRRKDGYLFPVEVTRNYLEFRGREYNCAFMRDITQRKQFEQALRESEQRFRLLAENSTDMISQHTPDGTFLYVSPACHTLLGYEPEELLGKSAYDYHHPDDVDAVRLVHTNILELPETYSVSYRFRHQQGHYLWLESTAKTIRSSETQTIQEIQISSRDITERKRAEVDIYNALAKEKELSQLKSSFVSMVSHEFRNPLSAIVLSSELLERYTQKASEEQKTKYFKRIHAATKRMTELLDEVLIIGRAEAGQLKCQPMPLLLEEFCQELVDELRLSIGQQYQLVFNSTGQGHATEACMDENLLRHILGNLISNAAKYSPANSTIHLNLIYENDLVVFQIQDQGIGIPEEDQQRLFDSFYRATNVGTIPGTGLGLAIVKKCVDAHHGQVEVTSQLNAGTKFTVTLPLHSSAPACTIPLDIPEFDQAPDLA